MLVVWCLPDSFFVQSLSSLRLTRTDSPVAYRQNGVRTFTHASVIYVA